MPTVLVVVVCREAACRVPSGDVVLSSWLIRAAAVVLVIVLRRSGFAGYLVGPISECVLVSELESLLVVVLDVRSLLHVVLSPCVRPYVLRGR